MTRMRVCPDCLAQGLDIREVERSAAERMREACLSLIKEIATGDDGDDGVLQDREVIALGFASGKIVRLDIDRILEDKP